MDAKKIDKALNATKMALDVAGVFDPTGIADLASGAISLGQAAHKFKQGDKQGATSHLVDAGISAVSALPLGDIAKLGKLRHLKKGEKAAEGVAKAGQEAGKAGKFSGWMDTAKQAFGDLLQGGAGAAGAKQAGAKFEHEFPPKAGEAVEKAAEKSPDVKPNQTADKVKDRLKDAWESVQGVYDTPNKLSKQLEQAESKHSKAAEAAKKAYAAGPNKFDWDKAEAARKAAEQTFAEVQRLKDLIGKRQGLKDQGAAFAAENLKARMAQGPQQGQGLFGFLGRSGAGFLSDAVSYKAAEKAFGKDADPEILKKTASLAQPYVQGAGTTLARGAAGVAVGFAFNRFHRAVNQMGQPGQAGAPGQPGQPGQPGSSGGSFPFFNPQQQIQKYMPQQPKGVLGWISPQRAAAQPFKQASRAFNMPTMAARPAMAIAKRAVKLPLGAAKFAGRTVNKTVGLAGGAAAGGLQFLGADTHGAGIQRHSALDGMPAEKGILSDLGSTIRSLTDPSKSLSEKFKELAKTAFNLPTALQNWSKALLDSQRRLSNVSGPQAMVFAQHDVRGIRRDILSGRATFASTEKMANALDDLLDVVQPIKDDLRNLANNVLTPGIQLITKAIVLFEQYMEVQHPLVSRAYRAAVSSDEAEREADARLGHAGFDTFLRDVVERERRKDEAGPRVPPR